MGSAIFTNIGIFFLKQIAKLSFKAIYIFSDVLFFVVFHIAGYRKKVVAENLKNSFPDKTESEIKSISKKFYRHLCDLILETIKMHRMTEKDFLERMVIENPEEINRFYDRGRSVVVLTMHYCNWEWSSCFPLRIKHKILGVYKPLHNQQFDAYLNKSRQTTGSHLVSNSSVLRALVAAEKKKEPVFAWLAADQTPPFFHKFWMKFLNRDTMFYPGPATISKRFNYPVFFQKIEKTGRGKYRTSFELLFENPTLKTEAEIMKAYIEKMEEVIKEQPEYYLWSHRRWKHQRPDDIPLAT
ncbi:MAG: lysophospholipid acyltransferase family protein [Tangfeifania sp.]